MPAKRVTVPAESTRRIRLLPVSARYRCVSVAHSHLGDDSVGGVRFGAASSASCRLPVAVTRTSRWLPVSAIQTRPSRPMASPDGVFKAADVATPPRPDDPALPVPAKVWMALPITRHTR